MTKRQLRAMAKAAEKMADTHYGFYMEPDANDRNEKIDYVISSIAELVYKLLEAAAEAKDDF